MPPAGRKAVFLGDLVDRGPRHPRCCASSWPWSRPATRCACPATTRPSCCARSRAATSSRPTGWPRPWRSSRRSRRSSRRGGDLHRRPGQPLRARRRPAGGRPRRDEGGDAEPGVGRVRAFALFGETSGESDEFGLPVRQDWARDYRGAASVVYGHTPVAEARWVNRTICIDTGCVFGGRLTALRWPERELVSVPAARTYCEPVRPLQTRWRCLGESDRHARHRRRAGQAHHRDAAAPDRHDPRGQRRGGAGDDEPVRGRSALADLPAADHVALRDVPRTRRCSSTRPKPSPTTARPASAQVVCEEKHMGSRAVVIACRDADAAQAALRRRAARPGSSTPAPAGRSSPTRPSRRRCSTGCARASAGPGSGTGSRPTGCAWTPS